MSGFRRRPAHEFLARVTALGWWQALKTFGRASDPLVLLADGRTGTNMLRSALNGHTQVHLYGELFKSCWCSDAQHLLEGIPRAELAWHPEWALARHVYMQPGMMCGYTLFYGHMGRPFQRRVWRFMGAFPGLRVLHLQRRNRFLQWLSIQEGFASGLWTRYAETKVGPRPPIHLSAQSFEDWVATGDHQREHACRRLEHCPTLEIYYEDLAEDLSGETARIFNWLGMPVQSVEAKTKVVRSGTLPERVANLEAFAGELTDDRCRTWLEEAIKGDVLVTGES